jgi:cytidylate kinase
VVQDGVVQVMLIAGPAGSGKTTLADAVAKKLSVRHLDFDVVSAGVVAAAQALQPELPEEEVLLACKEERYAALAEAIRECVDLEDPSAPSLVIASAPLSQYTQDSDLWAAWISKCGSLASVDLVWLDLDPKVRWNRMVNRKSSRDRALVESGIRPDPAPLPVVEHRVINAGLPMKERVRQALAPFSND